MKMLNKSIVFVLIISAIIILSYGAVLQKNFEDKKSGHGPESCDKHTPCGWAIYKQLTREIRGWVKNTNCRCDDGRQCYRIEDDISSGVYIYRCRERDPHETGDYISR